MGLLHQLRRHGRPLLHNEASRLEVAVRDEDDTNALVAALQQVVPVRDVRARPLRRLERWLARERIFGNYADGSG